MKVFRYCKNRSASLACHIMLVFLFPLLLQTGCQLLPADVCDVVNNPRKYGEMNPLKVKGVVSSSDNLGIFSYFVLKDVRNDCEIIVVTDRILPSAGEQITVTGTLDEAFKLGENRLLVIREKKKER